MARKSFRLRRSAEAGDAVGVGSYVRGLPNTQRSAGASVVDQDAALRSTGIIAVNATSDASVFEASPFAYNGVTLNWLLTEDFTPIEEVVESETKIVEVAVVYSSIGYPETVADGELLVQGALLQYNHQTQLTVVTDSGSYIQEEPAPGKWAYYTLFAYYNVDGPDGSYFYEKLASLEVLMPFNYGSTDRLWQRIPQYYRELDASSPGLDPENNNRGQLQRFTNIFGFEIDKTRTLIDAIMTQYDPLLAEANAVEELAKMLGLELNVQDIGVARTRALLHDIGYIRRQKGTQNATVAYLTAVSGGDVSVFTGASAPYYTFAVHSQKANLVSNPQFVGSSSWSVASEYSVTTTSASSGITITAGATATKVAVRSTVAVPVSTDTTYYMSGEFSGASAPIVYGALWHTANNWSAWNSATTAVSAISAGVVNRRIYQMDTPVSSASLYPVLVLNLAANQSITLKRWMVEPNSYGDFFDGDSVFGGTLYQGFAPDYKWAGTQYASYSIYTANRKKTQDAIERLLPKILPVTLMGTEDGQPKYNVLFDWIPGKTL
jgi:hypothetical protein